mmetsp:Transcript_15692/g.26452  ORF Transcript_15692/g.26452 Transcript_15692/m.26452 type:complete len:387 (+) Transcript_15692:459-1619(+)|eukprot:CAMPEP_0198207800 /NCGR_PEP_ID=MMETSP1445-20131203/11223_1 /TAXON_ID=36898 /ORGANISM="Pyramimonas sp., Strain CCMP2087" /LENGTH=386 /DNA_ID=CAMNT_0043880957 /DNA_START=773 /DNA_END=1933 /DNA_ORIENTATION=-
MQKGGRTNGVGPGCAETLDVKVVTVVTGCEEVTEITPSLKSEHTLGERVELLPVVALVKKPFKPTDEMRAHLADVKARTKEKAVKVDGGENFRAEVYSVAGSSELRLGNEDRFTLMENVAQGVLLMGVFDGHGGADTSDFLQKKLPAELAKQMLMAGEYTAENLATALRKSIAFCEEKYCGENLPKPKSAESDEDQEKEEVPEGGYTSSGACLLVCLYVVEQRMLVVANVGDSRGILALPPTMGEGGVGTAVGLSRDHTAGNPLELKRVRAAGGTVDKNGYICGEMAPSRAIGDVQFKGGDPDEPQNVIIAVPEIVCYRDVPAQALVLLASDGLWDTIRSDEAAHIALQTIEKTGDLSEACRRLVLEATQVRGSEDDTTLVMLQIL